MSLQDRIATDYRRPVIILLPGGIIHTICGNVASLVDNALIVTPKSTRVEAQRPHSSHCVTPMSELCAREKPYAAAFCGWSTLQEGGSGEAVKTIEAGIACLVVPHS